MRHRVSGRKLNRTAAHRKAMLRNMVTSLFEHEKIVTTDAKAKALKRLADRMVTLAKRGDLHARRQALATIRSKSVTAKLFDELREQFGERRGGYVRVIKKGYRKGDGAPVSIVELVTEELGKAKKKKKRGKGAEKARKGERVSGTAKTPAKTKPAEEAAPAGKEAPESEVRSTTKEEQQEEAPESEDTR